MNKIDKIVATFSKTVKNLRAEATRLDDKAHAQLFKADVLNEEAQLNVGESARADRIANNLEGLINV